MEVTLAQMLSAREARAFRQRTLNREWGKTMVCFSMNIPGPMKDSPLIRRGFLYGLTELDKRLPGEAIRHREVLEAVTGWEAVFVLDLPAKTVKVITTEIEDETDLGRLFDMDVLDGQCNKLDRELVGGKGRNCIVCGAPGRGCAARRMHSVPELQKVVRSMLTRHFMAVDVQCVGELAVRALVDEVMTTPKPGLVDQNNNGSHLDMDIHTFFASAHALEPYFRECVQIGMETAALPPQQTFLRLRRAGLEAEQTMLVATNGVNTHKGAIFTLGILCGAAGRLWKPEGGWVEQALFREASAMTAEAMERDFARGDGATVGQRLYAASGIRGVRGEVALGLPSVAEIGLPVYRAYRRAGFSQNGAGTRTLLHLIAEVEDTCLLHRGGKSGAREAMEKVCAMCNGAITTEQMEKLDVWFIQRNLSAGGCADLLAVTYFMVSLCQEEELVPENWKTME